MEMHTERSGIELLSVNTFISLAEKGKLEEVTCTTIAKHVSAVFDAPTLPVRLNTLISLMQFLQNETYHPLVSTVLTQCRQLIGLILGANNDDHIDELLEHRAKRLPFKPDFIRDAPRDAPLRKLLDDLVDWHQETDHDLAREKLRLIALASSVNPHKALHLKKRLGKTTLSRERRLFITLSIAHLLVHLLVKGTTKLVTEAYQEHDYRLKALEFKGSALEHYRVIPYNGRLYQLRTHGCGNDRRLQWHVFTTENMTAHYVHHGEALLVVTTSGDFYAGNSVDTTELGQNIYHSSFDRNPFFAGRFNVNYHGYLQYYDNHTGHFLHNERNLLCVTRFFTDIGLVGAQNPNVVAALVMQRRITQAEQSLEDINTPFHRYLQKLEEYPYWMSNKHLIPRLADHLRSDAVNLNFFLATKNGGVPTKNHAALPARDQRILGIRNDFDSGQLKKVNKISRQQLEELREKIRLKDRVNSKKIQHHLVSEKPSDEATLLANLYFYPHPQPDHYCSYRLRLNQHLIYDGQIDYAAVPNAGNQQVKAFLTKLKQCLIDPDPSLTFELAEIDLLKLAALRLQTYEQLLMCPPNALYQNRAPNILTNRLVKETGRPTALRNAVDPLEEIEQILPPNINAAFLEELEKHNPKHHLYNRRLQANNLFYGRMCLFHTNKNDDFSEFNPAKAGTDFYRIVPTLPIINHFTQPKKPAKASASPQQTTDSEEFETPLTLVRQKTYYN